MLVDICPTITVDNLHDFNMYIHRVASFALRIHIDLADGEFAPRKLLPIDQVWWPGGVRADLHVMYKKPFEHLNTFLALKPQLVIVHAEAEGDFRTFAKALHSHGIEVGVALLPATMPEAIQPALELIDHVMIFSGDLGHYGGEADLSLLEKVKTLLELKPKLEIGWDGGINDQNALALMRGSVDVLNVGSFIHDAPDPAAAHEKLQSLEVEK
jgi:ribulose-phosphate 3-epimerase